MEALIEVVGDMYKMLIQNNPRICRKTPNNICVKMLYCIRVIQFLSEIG